MTLGKPSRQFFQGVMLDEERSFEKGGFIERTKFHQEFQVPKI